jgi:TP901 family phage tail tape measure protein
MLANKMKAAEQPSASLTNKFNTLREAVNQLSEQETQLVRRLDQTRHSITAAGIPMRSLTEAQRALRRETASTTQAMQQQASTMSTQINRQERLAAHQRQIAAMRHRMQDSLQLQQDISGVAYPALGVGAASTAAIVKPVTAYADYEASATNLRAALMKSDGSVSPAFEQINALAEKLGNKLPGTTADFQNLMTMLTRQGISEKAILGGVGESAAYLAVQMGMDTVKAGEFAAKMQDATRTTDKDMMGLMDTIQRTFYMGVDADAMLEAFSNAGSAMDIIKMKGLEGAKALAPILTQLDQAGMKGHAAGNALRKIFQMGMDTKKVKDGSAVAGVKLDFTNGKGEFGGIENLYAQLEKIKGLTTEKRLQVIKKIFGNDAEVIRTLNTMTEKGMAGYKETQEKLNAQASLQTRVNEQLKTLKNIWDASSGTATNMLVRFGETIAPELKELIAYAGEMAEKTGNWAKRNPQLVATVMKVIAVTGVLMMVFGGLALTIISIVGPFAMFRFALGMIGLQFRFLTTGSALLGRAWGALSTVMKLAGTVLTWVGRVLLTVGRAALLNPIGLAITVIAVGAILIWKNWDRLGKWWNSFDMHDVGLAVGKWLRKAANTIENRWNTLAKWWDTINLKDIYVKLLTAEIDYAREKIQRFISWWDGISLKSLIANIEIPDFLGGMKRFSSGFTEGLNNGGARATGGPVNAGHFYRVNELGPELLQMSGMTYLMMGGANGQITPLTAQQAANEPRRASNVHPIPQRRAGDKPIVVTQHNTITIYATPGMDEQAIARAVSEQLEAAERKQAARRRAAMYD